MATVISIVSLGISLTVGIWALIFNLREKDEMNKKIDNHEKILRNSRP